MSVILVDTLFVDIMTVMNVLDKAALTILKRYITNVIYDPTIRIKVFISYYGEELKNREMKDTLEGVNKLRNEIVHRKKMFTSNKERLIARTTEFLNYLTVIKEHFAKDGHSFIELNDIVSKYNSLLGVKQTESVIVKTNNGKTPFYFPLETSPFEECNSHLYTEETAKCIYIIEKYPNEYKNMPIKILDGKHAGRTAKLVRPNGTTFKIHLEGATDPISFTINRLITAYIRKPE